MVASIPPRWGVLLVWLATLGSTSSPGQAPGSVVADQADFAFSAYVGSQSREHTLTLTNTSRAGVAVRAVVPEVDGRPVLIFRRGLPPAIAPGESVSLSFRFVPDEATVGVLRDTLVFETVGSSNVNIPFRALTIANLEQDGERPLNDVLAALGYEIDTGWENLVQPDEFALRGPQIPADHFVKAGSGPVRIEPLARFSPDGLLGFGYYAVTGEFPEQEHLAALAASADWHDNKTLFPRLEEGETTFDPGEQAFGLFVSRQDRVVYGEERWNKQFNPDNVARAMRIYPVSRAGTRMPERTYLVCFEESEEPDYQDVVFLIHNASPVDAGDAYGLGTSYAEAGAARDLKFWPLLEQDNLDGWTSYIKAYGRNRDPNQVFEVSDGVLRISGDEAGYIRTEEAFEGFHLRFEYRWGGESTSPDAVRRLDGGVIYYVEESQVDHIWPRGIEFDLRPHDAGDIWLHSGTTLSSSGQLWGAGRPARLVKLRDAELPVGEWNTAEIIADNGEIAHIVNGMLVNQGTDASVRRGRILIQSAGSEIFFRNIEVRKWRPEPSFAGEGVRR